MFNTFKEIVSNLPSNKRSFAQILFNLYFNQPFRLIVNYKLGNRFVNSKNPLLRLYSYYLKNKQCYNWSCDISYQCTIGKNVSFGHPVGIVIGKCTIEDEVKIWQNVTIGSHGKNNQSKKYPYIKKGAKIYSGSVIIGGVTIGENAVVGANSLVNIDVPDNAVAVGSPCKIISKNE